MSNKDIIKPEQNNEIGAEICYKRGQEYYIGEEESQDFALAYEWFCKAAAQEHREAQYHLGAMYYNGSGIFKNDEKAMEWFRKAAEQGHVVSMYNLGCAYLSGEGLNQDIDKAVEWLNMAAEQGHAGAQYNLGHLLYNGEIVPQDQKKAFELMSNAAEQGIGYAQFMLCLMYDRGHGVSENIEMCFHWCMTAIENGCEEAKEFANHLANSGKIPDNVKKGVSLVRRELGRQLLGEENNCENDMDAINKREQANVDEIYAWLEMGSPEKALELTHGVVTPAEVLIIISEEMNKKKKSKELLMAALDKFMKAEFQEGSELSKKAFDLYPFGEENVLNSLVYAIDNNTNFAVTEQKINFTREEHAYFLLHQCIYKIKRNEFSVGLINLIQDYCEALVNLSGEEKRISIDNMPSKIRLYTRSSIVESPFLLTYDILLHGYEKCKEMNLELGDYESLVALYKEASRIQQADEDIPIAPY